MHLQAVVFDMDGVLADTVKYHFQSWKKVCDEYGLPFSEAENEKLRGLTRQQSIEVILKGRVLPKAIVQAILERKNKYFLDSIRKMGPQDISPGVVELLQELRTAHIPAGVASSSQNAHLILDQLGIDRFMEVIIDGTTIQQSKPAPEVFLHTANALKAAPSYCLAIEDSEAGIQAARAAGMCVLGIGPVIRAGVAHANHKDLSGVHLKQLRGIYTQWQMSQPLAVSLEAAKAPTNTER